MRRNPGYRTRNGLDYVGNKRKSRGNDPSPRDDIWGGPPSLPPCDPWFPIPPDHIWPDDNHRPPIIDPERPIPEDPWRPPPGPWRPIPEDPWNPPPPVDPPKPIPEDPWNPPPGPWRPIPEDPWTPPTPDDPNKPIPEDPWKPPPGPWRPIPEDPWKPPPNPWRPPIIIPDEPDIPPLEPPKPPKPPPPHPPPQPFNGQWPCDPYMLPYATYFYPYGPCGPKLCFCPYVALTLCPDGARC